MYISTIACFTAAIFVVVKGHGYMIEPAARNSMWRKGFKNPKDYNDNELNCGGFRTQWQKNNGKLVFKHCFDFVDLSHFFLLAKDFHRPDSTFCFSKFSSSRNYYIIENLKTL